MTAVRSLSLVFVLAAASTLVSCKCPQGGDTAARLDGRTYKVTLVSPGGNQMADDLMFRNGRFESSVCTSAGFTVVPYHVQTVENGFRFNAQCDSPKMGHNEWEGIVHGDQIDGTVVRTPKEGAPIASTFSGKLVQ
jgi:hypothetical protein